MATTIRLKRLFLRKPALELQHPHDPAPVPLVHATEFHWEEGEEPAPHQHDVPSDAPPLCAAFPPATTLSWRFRH